MPWGSASKVFLKPEPVSLVFFGTGLATVLGFAARRRVIERIGLPQVRARRLAQLVTEEAAWDAELSAREHALPELAALTVIRVDGQDI